MDGVQNVVVAHIQYATAQQQVSAGTASSLRVARSGVRGEAVISIDRERLTVPRSASIGSNSTKRPRTSPAWWLEDAKQITPSPAHILLRRDGGSLWSAYGGWWTQSDAAPVRNPVLVILITIAANHVESAVLFLQAREDTFTIMPPCPVPAIASARGGGFVRRRRPDGIRLRADLLREFRN